MKNLIWIIAAVVIFLLLQAGKGKKKKPAAKPAPKPAPKPVAAPAPAAPAEPKPAPVKRIPLIPGHADGKPLLYSYDVKFTPEPGVDVAGSILAGEEKIVQLGADGDDVILIYEGITFGRIHAESRARMTADFISRGDPVGAVLRADAESAMLLYYRDPRDGQEWRPQEVVTLRGFKGRAKQDILAMMRPGDPLELEEDQEHDKRFSVTYKGEEIGYLPASVVLREDEDPTIVALEETVEEYDENDRLVITPKVHLYW